jgi:thiol:disulfide interchange protein
MKRVGLGVKRTALLVVGILGAAGAWAGVYPPVEAASTDIRTAIAQAGHEHKHVLIDFGGDWCGDCKVLDGTLHKPENAALLDADYVTVHVNVGSDGISDNFVVAERYGIPLKKGVPALAVLDSTGKLLYAQRNGEFESMRHMDPTSVHEFLDKWKPQERAE